MRRSIMIKTPDSHLSIETSNYRYIDEIQISIRPSRIPKPTEASTESHIIQTDCSNHSLLSFKKSQLLYHETSSNLKQVSKTNSSSKVKTIKISKKSRLATIEHFSTQRKKPKNIKFCIQGRPLTASSINPESRKSSQISALKKRSSIFSNEESDLVTPLDPKFLDESAESEDYLKLIKNSHLKNSIGVLASTNSNENQGACGYSTRNSPIPKLKFHSKTERKRIGLLVATSYATVRPDKGNLRKKGKIAKGLSNKPINIKRPKLVHNIVVS